MNNLFKIEYYVCSEIDEVNQLVTHYFRDNHARVGELIDLNNGFSQHRLFEDSSLYMFDRYADAKAFEYYLWKNDAGRTQGLTGGTLVRVDFSKQGANSVLKTRVSKVNTRVGPRIHKQELDELMKRLIN